MAVPYTKIITTLPEYKKELGGRKIPSTRIISDIDEYNKYVGGGGGGFRGGGGLTPEQARELEAERKRQEEELRRKQEEARRLQEEKQKEREKKIYSGTIGGQVENVKTRSTATYFSDPSKLPSTWTEEKQIKELREAGLTPIYRKTPTQIAPVGFTDTVTGKSVPIEIFYTKEGYTRDVKEDPIKTIPQKDIFQPTIQQSMMPEKKKESIFKQVGSIFAGEKGKRFTGIGLPGLTIISFQDIKSGLQKKGKMPGKVIAEFIPTTPLGVGATAGVIGGAKFIPPVIRIGGEAFFTYSGVKGALDVEQPTEKRIASGIIGGASAIGLGIETAPYIKGTITKITPKYRGVKKAGGTKIIENVPSVIEQPYDIALIPEGAPLGGKTSIGVPAYKKGGFGFTMTEQKAYIGKTGQVTTSARSLFAGTEKISISTAKDPLGIYATPFPLGQPELAQTRTSRLGLATFKDLFKIPGKEAKISFKKEAPQIVVFEKAKITKTGKTGTFKAIGKPSTELEVTATGIIESLGKKATTSIYGQKVDIFSARLLPGTKPVTQAQAIKSFSKTTGFSISSAKGIQTIPISSVAPFIISTPSYFEGTRETQRISETTQPIIQTRRTIPKTKGVIPTYQIQKTYKLPTLFYPTYPTETRPPTAPTVPLQQMAIPYTPTAVSKPLVYPSKSIYESTFGIKRARVRFKEKSKSLFQIFGQPTKYQPSFTGSILNIRTRVPKNYQRYGFGALRVRGIPTKMI